MNKTPHIGPLPADAVPIPGHEGFFYSEVAAAVYQYRARSTLYRWETIPAGVYEVQPEQRYQLARGWPQTIKAIHRLCFPPPPGGESAFEEDVD